LKTTDRPAALQVQEPAGATRSTKDIVWSFAFAYLLVVALAWSLIYAAGFWNFIGNTRLLDLFIRSGIVRFHDAQAGFIEGLPSLEYYVASQDPVDWGLLLVTAGVFVLFWGIKSFQFHSLVRFVGARGGFGEHVRAYLYGRGIGRLLPFDIGHVAIASAMQQQGVAAERAGAAVFMTRLLVIFEVAVFAAIGVFYLGWSTWLNQIAWALILLAAATFFVSRVKRSYRAAGTRIWESAKSAFHSLAMQPSLLVQLAALSIVAFSLEITAVYLISQAFTSENVILNMTVPLCLMAMVSGYVASFVRVTPGGFGQFEWGFGAALYLGGVGIPEAVTLALLFTAVRWVAGAGVFIAVRLGYGVETDVGKVLRLFQRGVSREEPA
jgi:hypothetical protein